MVRILRVVGVLWLITVCAAGTLGLQAHAQKGLCVGKTLYARHAIDGDVTVKSPDGKKSVTTRRVDGDPKDLDGWRTSIVFQAAGKRFAASLPGFRSEVLWSPDSQSFAVNETVGGGGIGQRIYVFYVERSQMRRVDVSPAVEKAFGSPVKCEVHVPPNTAILEWLDSQHVLVVAEVVPVSLCDCPGTFKSYEVSLPNPRVLRSHTESGTKQLFAGSLGCELDDADDACAKQWRKTAATGRRRQ
jgi:hypothetical protein